LRDAGDGDCDGCSEGGEARRLAEGSTGLALPTGQGSSQMLFARAGKVAHGPQERSGENSGIPLSRRAPSWQGGAGWFAPGAAVRAGPCEGAYSGSAPRPKTTWRSVFGRPSWKNQRL
jgi:hypothetical protein